MKLSKITKIQKIKCNKPVPVYDIGVKNNNNFSISNGLVVHNCKPYQNFKSTIYEKRIEMYDSTLLTEELIGLEKNNNNGKIDHSPGGINSKDMADAVCGALWNASKHAEEFDFEFGDRIDTMVDVSSTSTSMQAQQKQFMIDFEEELKKVSSDFSRSIDQLPGDDFYFANDIIVI